MKNTNFSVLSKDRGFLSLRATVVVPFDVRAMSSTVSAELEAGSSTLCGQENIYN